MSELFLRFFFVTGSSYIMGCHCRLVSHGFLRLTREDESESGKAPVRLFNCLRVRQGNLEVDRCLVSCLF